MEAYREVQGIRTNYSIERLTRLDDLREDLMKMAEEEDKRLHRHLKGVIGIIFEIEEMEMQLHT
jgi:hypothetical protein